MGAGVKITWEGIDTVINNLDAIEQKASEGVIKQTKALASATEQAWKDATPRRTGKLQEGDRVEVDGMSFTLRNAVQYYPFVSEGHMTPRGWRTRRGYRVAKRRSRVEGKLITEKAIQFVEQNIRDYLSRFLDGV